MKRPFSLAHLPMRARLLLSFLVLIVILLSVLWLTQVIFLEDIYKSIKARDLSRTAERLADRIAETGTADDLSTALYGEDDYCVLVLSFAENVHTPTVLYRSALSASGILHEDCVVHAATAYSQFYPLYYDAALREDETVTQRYVFDSARRRFLNIEGDLFAEHADSADNYPESVLLTRVVHTEQNGTLALFVNAVLTPVTATTETLNSILLILTGFLLLAGVLLSYLLARRLSAPFIAMTEDAKKLAAGATDTTFTAHGYREAEELAEALTRAAAELEKAALLRRELLANVSHDLRTPVTLIAGYSEMIRDMPGENTPENAEILLGEANRLSALIDDLMDLSKLEAGVQELVPSVFPLTETLRDAMERYDKLHTDVTITFTADTDLVITSDKTRVLQVLYNLVNNAVNHVGDDRTVAVAQTELPAEADGRTWVRISVTDHGKGIPEVELARIWDRYYKVDKTRRRSAVGTGLGLSIVRSTTQLLGGRGGVSSTPDTETVFWFDLPLSNGPPARPAPSGQSRE